ncbi:MAG: acetylserotonin O-methyltransferase [Myxococcaceae bacterium]|nr:acetylserotonin O-methyltransferase [Myxococcaceae bacterium]
MPAHVAVRERSFGVGATALLGVAARLRIADKLEGGPQTAAELAAGLGVDTDALHRVLRALVSGGIFALGSDGRFRNNRMSEPLRSNTPQSCLHWADYFGSASNLRAWADVEGTVRTGQSAFERVHGMSVWQWFALNPGEGRVFADVMVDLTDLEAAAVARAYPFGEHTRVCDVAGGRGTLLAEVLLHHPGVRGVLFDSPEVVRAAAPLLEARGVSGRVELQVGNFFDAVPEGCDAYVLKDVLHDWDDARALHILSTCRRAMAPGARLLIVEVVVETLETRAPGPLIDVQMMTVCSGGRQRSRSEFDALLRQAGFTLRRVVQCDTPLCVVEALAV